VTTPIWTPGMAGPLDDFVSRINRMVSAFAQDHELEHAEVRIELADGSRWVVEAVSADPGFGFLCLTPHRAAGDEPRRLVVPIGAIKAIEISAPDVARPLGFVPAE
jgi:hypothetical protein